LAIIPDFPILKGIIGIEVESIEGDVVAKSTIKANQVNVLKPVRFEFPVIKNSDKKINLKVFSQDLDNSLRIFEWRYFPWHGIAPVKKMIFCGYLFA
jgi:hypothetical protein